MIGWMIGILYLPRLFAYHADASTDTDETFQQMEYNLMRLLLMPCMIVVFITGILLIIATERHGERVASYQNSTRAHARGIARHDVAPAQEFSTR